MHVKFIKYDNDTGLNDKIVVVALFFNISKN